MAVATVASCRAALHCLDPERPQAAITSFLSFLFVSGGEGGGLSAAGETDAQRAFRTKAFASVDEARAESVQLLCRRALHYWPRWHAPPPADPTDVISIFEAEQGVGVPARHARDEQSPSAGLRRSAHGTGVSRNSRVGAASASISRAPPV